jgi:hypothetical protein
MENALPTSQRIHDDHERLCDWMAQAENELRGKEVLGDGAETQIQVIMHTNNSILSSFFSNV